MLQTKEQGINLQDQINEDEIGNLPEKEFRVMIVKMIQILGNRMEKMQETFNKDLEELESKQTMMNNTINEIKNSLDGINSRITEAEKGISNLPEKEFRIMIVKMIQDLGKRTEAKTKEMQEMFNKGLEN